MRQVADMGSFRLDVYSVVRAIPRGRVIQYGQIARLIGYPRHSRLVGRMLRETTADSGLPCHRVVNSSGRTSPRWPEQAALLAAEGVIFKPNGCVDMGKCGWDYTSLSCV